MNFLVQIWRLLDGAQRRWVLMAQGASLLMASSTLLGIAAISRFFALVADPALVTQSQTLIQLRGYVGLQDDHGFVVLLGLFFGGMVILTNLLSWAGAYTLQRVALKVGDDIQAMLFREYLNRNALFHADTHSATLCNNVAYETERGVVTALESAFALITSLVTAVLVICTVLIVNPLASAMVGALVTGYGVIYFALRGRIYRAGEVGSTLAALRTKLILETFGAIKEITVARKQGFFEGRFEEASAGLSRRIAYLDALTSTPKYLMESMAVCGLIAVALMQPRSSGVGHWLAQLTFLGFALYRLLPALQQSFACVVKIRAAGASFAVIAEDLRLARRRRPNCLASPPLVTGSPIRSIEMCKVSFRYGPCSAAVLDGVSLAIVPGTIVGLIGANGSGKTTLLDVLAGLLPPDSGQVIVDGAAIEGDGLARWQSHIAYVPQCPFLLDVSIEENIALGVEPGKIDRDKLQTAARLARFDEVVRNLPSGYRERIGERGTRLSGGQRQRLGIARALYSNASILLMDESTNALDEQVEAEVMTVIEGLRRSRTIVLIAHRRSTLERCDAIYELCRGKIMASGVARNFAGNVASQSAARGQDSSPDEPMIRLS